MIRLMAAAAIVALSGCAFHHPGEPRSLAQTLNNNAMPEQPSAERWDGSIRYWGTMREVLKEGQVQPRVHLQEVAQLPGTVGVGALESLQGEITILDDRIWLAREAKGSKGELPSSVLDSATLLIVASVPNWLRIPIEPDRLQTSLDGVLRDEAQKAGIDVRRPFPFILEGRMSVEAHVIRGQCPHATDHADEPIMSDRLSRQDVQAMLVGFYAEGAEGILTHHGSTTHIHVVIHGDPSLSGHVDSVKFEGGAVLRLPAGI